ncbi:MAG: plastocyanin/azurin family copper-binding protein [Solirubrobacteraceae bacterium]
MGQRLLIAALIAAVVALGAAPALAVDGAVRTTSSDTFSPATVYVKPGEKVTFSQTAGAGLHNVVFVGNSQAPIPSVSPTLDAFSDSRTFATQGTFNFFCSEHASPDGRFGMVGKVVANPAGAPAPVVSAVSAPVFLGRATLRFRSSADGSLVAGAVYRRAANGRFLRFTGLATTTRVRKNLLSSIRLLRPAVGRTLEPGVYRAGFRVRDPFGQRSLLRSVRFTIPRPR